MVSALKKAFEQANGRFITRMDADDVMPINRLAIMSAALINEKGNTVVTGLVKYFSENNLGDGFARYEKWLNDVVSTNSFKENYI